MWLAGWLTAKTLVICTYNQVHENLQFYNVFEYIIHFKPILNVTQYSVLYGKLHLTGYFKVAAYLSHFLQLFYNINFLKIFNSDMKKF